MAEVNPLPKEPERTVLPITFLDSKKVLPRRYVIHKHTKRCRSCSTTHDYTNVYAFNEMASRTGAGKVVIHLVPVDRLEYDLPIEVISVPLVEVPICHECVGKTSLSHLPDPRAWDEWKQRYVFVATSEIRRPAGERPFRASKVPPTIDDLLN